MVYCSNFTACSLALSAALLVAGCDKGAPPEAPPGPAITAQNGGATPAAGEHDHSTVGPHRGGLIELGSEEYHAELLHDDDAGTVTIYLLDGHAKEAVPIDAEQVTINLTRAGKPQQFQLAASPQEGDPEGKSSRFVSNDAALAESLDEDDARARLVVKIDGKSYNGQVAHDHDHDHDHHDHDD